MKRLLLLAAILLATHSAYASDQPVEVAENQAVVQVNGVVCSFCAYGAEKALSELDCLNAAEFGNGVLVDIDTHRITLAMRAGQAIPFGEIYQRIKKAGYDPITIYLRSTGTLKHSGDRLLLHDQSRGQTFSIVDNELAVAADQASADARTVSVQVHFSADQIPALGVGELLEVTIDRLIADSGGARADG